jgi:hypothetical protein
MVSLRTLRGCGAPDPEAGAELRARTHGTPTLSKSAISILGLVRK